MRILKLLSAFLFLIILLLTAAYLNRCRIVESILTSALKEAGIRPVTVRINELGLQRLTINNLSLSKPVPEGELIVDVKHISARYSLLDLLSGKVDSLAIKKLEITLPQPEQPKNSPTSLPDISQYLIIPPLPPCDFTINTLIINGKQLGLLSSRPLHLQGKINKTLAQFTLVHPSDPYGPTTIIGELEASGRINLDLTNEKTAKDAPLHLELTVQSNTINGLVVTDLQKTRTILTPFFRKISLPKIQGTARCSFELKQQQQKSLLIKVEGEIENIDSTNLSLDNAEVRLSGKLKEIEPGRLLFNAEPGLEFKARDIKYQDKIFDLISGLLTANLEIKNRKTTISAIGQPRFTINGFHMKGLQIDEVSLHPLLELKQQANSYKFACWPPFQINLRGMSTKELTTSGRMTLSAKERFEAELEIEPKFTFTGNSASWDLSLDNFQMKDTGISMAPLTISNAPLAFSSENSSWQAELFTEQLELVNKTGKFFFTQIFADINGQSDEIAINGHMLPRNIPGHMELKLDHNLSSTAGTARLITTQPITFSEQKPLSNFVTDLSFPLKINEGELALQANLQWSKNTPLSGDNYTTLSNISGIYDEITFKGLNLSQSLNINSSITTSKPLTLSVAEVQCGVPITDISLKARLLPGQNIPLIAVDKIRADLLNGRVYAQDLRYNHRATINTFNFKVRGLDLASVASAMNLEESLDLGGKVDGTVPLELSADGVRVHNGTFVNQKPGGIIRYLTAKQSGLDQSPLTEVVQKALEDFHYDLLEASADFQPSGELKINIHMEGKSPRLETNRPVHINLNTQQNIFSLLKSLRYSGAMTDELNKKLQQKYGN
ncbi:MAG: YdbH domain-containing protein [Desulfobulbaceae bacterium]|nr:YdbH domain-containing protein [Desulfobulbaceae bacterium]